MVNNVVKDCSGFNDNKIERLGKLNPGNKDKLLLKILIMFPKFTDCKLAFSSRIFANTGATIFGIVVSSIV
jgi:hypothetical protein